MKQAEIKQIKDRIDIRLNNHLCEMKEGYDDSIVGFNEAWDIVRSVFGDALRAFDQGQPLTCLVCHVYPCICPADREEAIVAEMARQRLHKPQPESEVMPHFGPESSASEHNATAPVMGADPPWLEECRDFAWPHIGKKPHATDSEIARAQNAITRRLLAFANAQPPSEAEVQAAMNYWIERGTGVTSTEAAAALIAAAKARSNA